MSSDWVLVYSVKELYLAEMAKKMLNDNGIDAVILNQKDSMYPIGDIGVRVKIEYEDSAKLLIKQFEN